MRIILSPFAPPPGQHIPLAASIFGDVLTINGEAFDFTQLPEGATLPHGAIASDWITGPVSRINGELHLKLRLPLGPNPSQAATFPEPIHVTQDGPVTLPSDESESQQ